MPAESQGPAGQTVEWGKALVAGFTDDVVAELLELVRHGTDDRAEVAGDDTPVLVDRGGRSS